MNVICRKRYITQIFSVNAVYKFTFSPGLVYNVSRDLKEEIFLLFFPLLSGKERCVYYES